MSEQPNKLERMGDIIDLRDNGFSYNLDSAPGSKVRWYDLFSEGMLGGVGDTLIWLTPHGSVKGEIVETGWENKPFLTYWADVIVAESE